MFGPVLSVDVGRQIEVFGVILQLKQVRPDVQLAEVAGARLKREGTDTFFLCISGELPLKFFVRSRKDLTGASVEFVAGCHSEQKLKKIGLVHNEKVYKKAPAGC